jgi:Skp family chaperone for outer membrane proteins
VDLLSQYLQRSQEIIGDRTREEIRYDKEVLRWLRKGKKIQKAIERANKKYPKEALEVNKKTINEVAAHYDYLLEHENIMKKMH